MEMIKNEVVLFFPPIHDFSLPYLAPPFLKASIEKNCNIKCATEDLNLRLFLKMIGQKNYLKLKSAITNKIKQHDLVGSINDIILFEEYCLLQINSFLKKYPEYIISLRKITPMYNAAYSQNIYQDIIFGNNFLCNFYAEILSKKKYLRTKIFGISISVEDQIIPSFILAKKIKDYFTDSLIVIGGNIVTRLYDNIVKSNLSNFVDYLIIKEGEEPIQELVDIFLRKIKLHFTNPKIINVINERNLPRQYRLRHFRKSKLPITDIDNLVLSNFNNYKLDLYSAPFKIVPISLSRKCYWGKCEFCSIHTSWDMQFRSKSLGTVLSELHHHIKKGIAHFRIIDEDCPPYLLNDLANKLIDDNLSINYEVYTRFESVFLDSQFCNKLYKSGCRHLFFGLESIGSETLKLITKGLSYTKENITKILQNTAKAGILNYLFVLTGIPNSPIKEEEETVKYILDNRNIHSIALSSFVIDKDSPIHKNSLVRKKYNVTLKNIGDTTTEIGYLLKGKDVRAENRKRTSNYITIIFNSRPDLALNYLINEETRFILSCKFGNKFASEYIRLSSVDKIHEIVNRAINKNIEERIERKLFFRSENK